MIPNHYSAALSDVDLKMVRAIPPGGNWKDIPRSIPSKRLDQIRASFKRGEGSRSTYYGRLRDDAPAYTINTYFSRPGNGCHIHYAQDRVLSQREAARLQSFPDSFEFHGSRSAVNVQIGNAVPPLLAYQIARRLGEPGYFVDLFAGAGGLSLGFSWAGWQPILANDVEPRFLETYAANVHSEVICGDIRDEEVRSVLINRARKRRRMDGDKPFLVLGGPPCQGFSTAGKRRSVDDERNHLFRHYRLLLDAMEPDAFVFENVAGLLNMEGGRVFAEIRETLAEAADDLVVWRVQAESHAVPQRRTRLILVGQRGGRAPEPPPAITAFPQDAASESPVVLTPSVADALEDLPPLKPGQDGSDLEYSSEAATDYQRFVRGVMSAERLVDSYGRHAELPGQLALDLTSR